MEPLALDPCGYSGSYKLIGGRPSLDLVNTISWPETDRQHDWLQTAANVERWLDAVGLDTVPVTKSDLLDVIAIRRAITDVVRPLARGENPALDVVRDFNGHLSKASSRRRLDPKTLVWAWIAPQHVVDTFAPVVVDAADLVVFADHKRLKQCPSCEWVFLDETRNGRRRWCDMVDCGSRAKARTYYHRHKT